MTPHKREKAWSDFTEWCKLRKLRPLPAHPWTVAAYARWCEARHRFPVILKRIKAIARVHVLECVAAPDRHPTVTRTLRTLEVRHRARADRSSLFVAEDFTQAAAAPAAKPVRRKLHERRRGRSLRAAPRLVSRRPSDR